MGLSQWSDVHLKAQMELNAAEADACQRQRRRLKRKLKKNRLLQTLLEEERREMEDEQSKRRMAGLLAPLKPD